MEGFDLGIGFAVVLLGMTFALHAFKVAAIIIAAHFTAMSLKPLIAGMVGFGDRLTGSSLHDVIAYWAGWLPITILLSFFAEVAVSTVPMMGEQVQWRYGNLTINYYLLGLTLWYYDKDLTTFKVKALGKVAVQGILFLVLNMVLHIALFSLEGSIVTNPSLMQWVHFVVVPMLHLFLAAFFGLSDRLLSHRRWSKTDPDKTSLTVNPVSFCLVAND